MNDMHEESTPSLGVAVVAALFAHAIRSNQEILRGTS